jgi:hypothetical protein
MNGPVIDTERFMCQDVHREIEAPRESQQPGKQCLAGQRLNIEGKFAYGG